MISHQLQSGYDIVNYVVCFISGLIFNRLVLCFAGNCLYSSVLMSFVFLVRLIRGMSRRWIEYISNYVSVVLCGLSLRRFYPSQNRF